MIERINRTIDRVQETYYKFIWYRDWLLFGFATFKNVLSEWIAYKELMLKHEKEAAMKALINVRLNKGDSIPNAEFAANVIFEMMESSECFSFWFILFKSRLLERAWIQNKEKETKNETLF